jgi:hypothetical protein
VKISDPVAVGMGDRDDVGLMEAVRDAAGEGVRPHGSNVIAIVAVTVPKTFPVPELVQSPEGWSSKRQSATTNGEPSLKNVAACEFH